MASNSEESSEDIYPLSTKKSKKREREHMSEQEKAEERKAANRRSAHQSRLRKNMLIEELQKKVTKLNEEIAVLKENNRTLSLGLEASIAENQRLRLHQQAAGLGAPLAGPIAASLPFLGLNGGVYGGLFGGAQGF